MPMSIEEIGDAAKELLKEGNRRLENLHAEEQKLKRMLLVAEIHTRKEEAAILVAAKLVAVVSSKTIAEVLCNYKITLRSANSKRD